VLASRVLFSVVFVLSWAMPPYLYVFGLDDSPHYEGKALRVLVDGVHHGLVLFATAVTIAQS